MPSSKYYHKNPEYYKKLKREWNKNNKLHISAYNIYYKTGKYTPEQYKQKFHKGISLNSWIGRNMHPCGYTWDEIYNIYINTKECFYCGVDFTNRKKNLDHDHKTGKIRGVLCSSCNRTDVLADID
tara:strand:- start:521 stop:898 length:378 start_codon:yes stop_codon:yes gene_type:complete